jgi:two-component system, LytTR family, response regulator
MYTCIIVDDLTEAVNLIRDHVLKIFQLNILLMTTNSIEALTFLDKSKPDIIFLDIEMPGMTGIDIVASLRAKWGNNIPKIVFTTGHADYALTGYEHGVADYLVKPVTFSRFKQCTDRIIDELNMRNLPLDKPGFFFADTNGEKVKINFEDIIYIEGAGNYITIATTENNKTIYKSMNAMQQLLPSTQLIRVHKSFFVAIDRVQSVRGNELTIKVKNGVKDIPVGITFKENVFKQLGIG